jgi:hypothetical protein
LAALSRPKRRREVGNVSVCISALDSLRKFGLEFSMTGVETKRILGKGMNSTRGKFGRRVSCLLYIGPYNLSLMGNPMADYKLVV